jgi:hypothetical protein
LRLPESGNAIHGFVRVIRHKRDVLLGVGQGAKKMSRAEIDKGDQIEKHRLKTSLLHLSEEIF